MSAHLLTPQEARLTRKKAGVALAHLAQAMNLHVGLLHALEHEPAWSLALATDYLLTLERLSPQLNETKP